MIYEGCKYYDYYATLPGFREICRVAGNLKKQEIRPLVREVKKCPFTYSRKRRVQQYEYEDLYRIFISNPFARVLCEKQKILCWEDVVYRYIDKTEEDRVRYEVRRPYLDSDYNDYIHSGKD